MVEIDNSFSQESLQTLGLEIVRGMLAESQAQKAAIERLIRQLEQERLERKFYQIGKACLTDIKETYRPSQDVVRSWQESVICLPKQQLAQQQACLQRFSEGMGIYEDFSDPFYRPSLNQIQANSALNQIGTSRYFTPSAELFAFSIEVIAQSDPINGVQATIGTSKDLKGIIDLSKILAPIAGWVCENQLRSASVPPLDNH